MSDEINAYAIKDCHARQFPCIPDVRDPILSVRYLGIHWAQTEDKKALTAMGKKATDLGLVVCIIRRHRCIRLSDFQKVILHKEDEPEEFAD